MADSAVTTRTGRTPAHPILEQDATSEWLGIEVVHTAPGEATIAMELRPEMLNGFGIAHGGMVFAFADTAFALACNPHDGPAMAEAPTVTVASGADINFLASAKAGDRLTAVARHRASAGRSGVYDIEITADFGDGSGTVIAEVRGRSRTIPNPRLRR